MNRHTSHLRFLTGLLLLIPGTAWSVTRAELDGEALPPPPVKVIRASLAFGLLRLGTEASARGLYNDAERLLGAAQVWSPSNLRSQHRLAANTAERRATYEEPRKQEYQQFLNSRRYAEERGRILRAEAELKGECFEKFLALARQALGSPDEELASIALTDALALNSEDPRLQRTAGKKRLEKVREERAQESGLARLNLGETILGRPLSVADLRGKVVVWRSFSL